MYPLIRPLLFRLDPEKAHNLTLVLLRMVGAVPPLGTLVRRLVSPTLGPVVQAFGQRFSNPIGLAAGYDKDGVAWRGLACLGFGHIEVGTVTPNPQPGNPRPRVFRLPSERGLINSLGFPSRGGDFVARQLNAPRPNGLIVGVNLGVNKDTPLENAAEDYLQLMKRFAPLADYLAINVSSPNTVGLRRLQGRQHLQALLSTLTQERQTLVSELGRSVPLLVKLSPDLTEDELEDALDVILGFGLDGVIATNTTVSRQGVHSPLAAKPGGLSGAPLRGRSTSMVRAIHRRTGEIIPIIAAGGVMQPKDVGEKLDAGAILVQVYTGLIYQGPGLVRQLLRGMA